MQENMDVNREQNERIVSSIEQLCSTDNIEVKLSKVFKVKIL